MRGSWDHTILRTCASGRNDWLDSRPLTLRNFVATAWNADAQRRLRAVSDGGGPSTPLPPPYTCAPTDQSGPGMFALAGGSAATGSIRNLLPWEKEFTRPLTRTQYAVMSQRVRGKVHARPLFLRLHHARIGLAVAGRDDERRQESRAMPMVTLTSSIEVDLPAHDAVGLVGHRPIITQKPERTMKFRFCVGWQPFCVSVV
jgi:hypothetical protein